MRRAYVVRDERRYGVVELLMMLGVLRRCLYQRTVFWDPDFEGGTGRKYMAYTFQGVDDGER